MLAATDPGDVLNSVPSLIPDSLAEQAAYGAMLYGITALFVFLVLSAYGKPLWGLMIAAVGLGPYLAFRYPVLFSALFPWAAWYAGRRWGWRRIFAAFALGLLFVSAVQVGVGEAGLAFGILRGLNAVGWVLFGGSLLYGLYRLVFAHNRGEYLAGYGWDREGRRVKDRKEYASARKWYQRKKGRVATQVKQGEKYQPRHAGGRNGNGATTATETLEVDAPEVADAWQSGQSGPTASGYTYDPMSGSYLPQGWAYDPDSGGYRGPGGILLGEPPSRRRRFGPGRWWP